MRQVGLLERPTADVGVHVCWRYDDVADFRAAADAFLADGERRKERLVYVADAPAHEMRDHLRTLDVERLIHRRQLVIRSVRDLYQPGHMFDGAAQVEAYRALVDGALAEGFTGLRVAAEASSLVADEDAHRQFVQYELAVDQVMATAPMSAMCAYDAAAVGDRISDLLAVHPCSHGSEPGPLHAHFDGSSLLVRGEADVATETVFDAVIFALTHQPAPERLDLSQLRFVDLHSLVRLSQVSAARSALGRPLQVEGLSALARRCAATLDLAPLLEAVVDA